MAENNSAAPAGPPRVEAAALSAAFVTAIRRAGLATSPDRAARLAEALHLIPPGRLEQLYWTCRVVLVSAREQVPVFDAVFAAVFGGNAAPAHPGSVPGPAAAPPAPAPRTRPAAPDSRTPGTAPGTPPGTQQRPRVASPGRDGSAEDGRTDREAVLAMVSADEHLQETSFAELAADEVAEVRRLAAALQLATPLRLSRRTRTSAHSTASLDVRATVRAARRSGTDAPLLLYARRRGQRRKLVLLCDVSGSMEPYSRVFVSLLQGAVTGAGAEAFVFSTRLTRLTRQLALRDPDRALARAAASAPDWAGGTRIADCLRRFVDEHGRRGLARGAVVVVFSDGWAYEDPEQVAAQMARLRRLAHRIIWVNPRKAAPQYQPLVGGMAAALPYCDAFVSGHSYRALAQMAAAIRGDGPPPQDTHERARDKEPAHAH
ncbi:vWA domain-containing protein [Arthrobacter sp. 9MFCol3.1]|uniref:vWA domain-containing protein n=1 Tax=Arthrobacter sp. 9MFCol3.1 TaxID=1150398 RepID=UPI00047EFB54|nr:VWA domain-containing protein [Arthrobacter sp. 9MFCol3.1]